MVKLRVLRKLCLDGVISTKCYWEIKRIKCLSRKRWPRQEFSLDRFTTDQCSSLFRFTPEEIMRLLKCFKIPNNCKLRDGQKFTGKRSFLSCFVFSFRKIFKILNFVSHYYTGLEGICILLRRLAYPNRLSDLEESFKRNYRVISKIFNWMLFRIYHSHGHVISELDRPWVTKPKLLEFANVRKWNKKNSS
jgi:hypothetical protein